MNIDNIYGLNLLYKKVNTKQKLSIFDMEIIENARKEIEDSRSYIAILKDELNKNTLDIIEARKNEKSRT